MSDIPTQAEIEAQATQEVEAAPVEVKKLPEKKATSKPLYIGKYHLRDIAGRSAVSINLAAIEKDKKQKPTGLFVAKSKDQNNRIEIYITFKDTVSVQL